VPDPVEQIVERGHEKGVKAGKSFVVVEVHPILSHFGVSQVSGDETPNEPI
jgi:hypothetical protein